MGGENTIEGKNTIGIFLKGDKLVSEDKKEEKDKKLSEGGSTPQASSDQASAVPKDLIQKYGVLSKAWEGKETEEGTLINNVDFGSLGKGVEIYKNKRELFARAMVDFLKKFNPYGKIIGNFKSRITDEVINNDESYRNLVNEILDIISKKSIVDSNEKYKDVSSSLIDKFNKLANDGSRLRDYKVNLGELENKARYLFGPIDDNEELFAYAMLEFLSEVNERYEKSGADEKAYNTFKSELGKLGENDKEGYNKKAEEILNSIDALLQRVNSAEVPEKLVGKYKKLYDKYKELGCKLENPDQVIKASKQNSKRKHFVHVLTKFLEKNFDKDSQAEAKGYWEEMEGMKEDDENVYAGLVNRIFASIDNAKPPEPNNPPPLSSPEGYETQPILKENTNNILRRRKNNKSNNSAFTKPSMIDDNVLKEKVTNANESHNLNFSKAIGYGDAFTKPSMIDDNVLKEDVTNAGNLLVDLYTSDYNKLVKEFLDKKKDGRTEEDLKAELNKKADDKLKKRFEEEQQLCEEKDKGKLSRAQELNKSSKLIMYKFLELMNCLGANEGKIEDFRKQINEATDGDLIGKICKSTKDLVDKYSANSSPLSNALNQPSESELPPPPPPLPQNFSDPECQKQVIEKFLKNRLSGLIKQVKMWGFLDDNYNYDENIYCSFDYPSCKFLENVRVFWLKIAEIIYGGIKKIPSDDISYEIISFQNRIGNCLPRTEMQSLLSTDDFVKKSNSFLDYISNKILGIDSKNLLETKKSELIKSKDDTLNKLVSKYNELYKDDKHELTKNEDLFNLQCAIEGFWNILKGKLENGTKKEKKRAGTLNDFMDNYFKSVVKNNQVNIATYKDINHVKETFDQELNIIGRVILYLEKRKNKENEKGFFGKLFGKSKKSNDETKSDESNKSKEELKKEKKQKKEKLNNQKRLKKCFEDMGRYFVKHKKEDKVKLSDFKKLVKGKDPYATWSTDLGNTVLGDTNITKSENGKIEKKLLMGLLFLSLIDLGDKESVIAACDGLKAGGIKSNDTKLFEGKATSIRKAIKGKCSIDIRKDDLGDYIASLCGKYDLVEKTQANLITFKFVNEWKNESSSADTPEV